MNLTPEERMKFAAYCAHEARSYSGLAQQAEKLPGGDMLSKPMKLKAAAYALVARELSRVEEVTIQGTPPTTALPKEQS